MTFDTSMLHFNVDGPGEPAYPAPVTTSLIDTLCFEEGHPKKYCMSAMRNKYPNFAKLIDEFTDWYETQETRNPIKALTIPIEYFDEELITTDGADAVIAIFLPPELENFAGNLAAFGTDSFNLGPLDLERSIPYFHWCIHTDPKSYLSLFVSAECFFSIYSGFSGRGDDRDFWIPVLFIGRSVASLTGVQVNEDLAYLVSHNSLSSPPILGFSQEEIDDGLRKAMEAGSTTPWSQGYWSEREGHTVIQAVHYDIGPSPNPAEEYQTNTQLSHRHGLLVLKFPVEE